MRAMNSMAVVGLLVGGSLIYAGPQTRESPQTSKLVAEMEKCEICKAMARKPELLQEMTWETHKIDHGMLCVATVPKEHAKEFAALHKAMLSNVEKVKEELDRGQKVELCSFCSGMSELEKAGAKQEAIETATGAINLVTSEDPAIVNKIHAQADAAIAEQKKLQSQGQ
jgi:hypothetical protein